LDAHGPDEHRTAIAVDIKRRLSISEGIEIDAAPTLSVAKEEGRAADSVGVETNALPAR